MEVTMGVEDILKLVTSLITIFGVVIKALKALDKVNQR
jgi:hypothetical protein